MSIDRQYIEGVYIDATETFCDGIYVKSNKHPCGWDFIDFKYIKCLEEVFIKPIGINAISDGIYDDHEYEDMTIAKIISTVGSQGLCFEISGVEELR